MTDLHFTADVATEAETAAVDTVVPTSEAALVVETERLVRGGRARRDERRHLLLPTLHALQREIGWISPGGVNLVAARLQVPPAEVYGVATFYHLFRTTDPGHTDPVEHVCVDAACRIAGSSELLARRRSAGAPVQESPCLGQCERAPAVFVQGRGTADHVPADAAGGAETGAATPAGGPYLLRRIGVVDPTSLDDHRAHGGHRALDRAIELGADAVIAAITEAGLTGRGGAGFPTGVKWRAVADQTGPCHVVANGDESEPGTFKDRVLMEGDPFALVEALTIAGIACGAEQGWIYVRGEYPLAAIRLRHAIAEARAAGLLGADVAGSGHRFDIELRRGAGAYVCGEETALFESIEGRRGEPRNKPPFPTTHGLFGRPTAVNNPETLLNVTRIVTDGAAAYRSVGTEGSPGTKLFCLSGRVARPGVYEVPFGTTLGSLIDLAGGATGAVRAVLMGGAAGSFVGPDAMDLPLSSEDARAAGTTLGSGVVMVFDGSDDMGDVVERLARFFRDESCGQCVPCRIGTVRQHEVLVEMRARGTLSADRVELLDDLRRVMADASICGLGHTAGSALASALGLGLLPEATDEGGFPS